MDDIEAKQARQEYNRQYYAKNKYILCHKTLNVYCVKKIKSIRALYTTRVEEYIIRYPFEKYAEPYIRKRLFIHRVPRSQSHYDDCFSAGMVAYMYSIHRCAEMSYTHVEPYIKKLVRIYIICALVIHDDTRNLCRANNFKQVRLNADDVRDKY